MYLEADEVIAVRVLWTAFGAAAATALLEVPRLPVHLVVHDGADHHPSTLDGLRMRGRLRLLADRPGGALEMAAWRLLEPLAEALRRAEAAVGGQSLPAWGDDEAAREELAEVLRAVVGTFGPDPFVAGALRQLAPRAAAPKSSEPKRDLN